MSRRNDRRQLLIAGLGAAAIAAVESRAFAQAPVKSPVPGGLQPLPVAPAVPIKQITPRLTMRPLPITRLPGVLGSTGNWGEVQVRELKSGLVPIYVRSANRAGVMDLTKSRATVSLGNGSFVLTSRTIQSGGMAQPWNASTISNLINSARKDASLRASLLGLRAALLTAYPYTVSIAKKMAEPRVAQALVGAAAQMGVRAMPRRSNCTTTTVTETIVREVEQEVERWFTAEERYADCVQKQVDAGIFGGVVAAAAYCAAAGFVDLFLGVVTVLVTIIEEVERTVVSCVLQGSKRLVDVFNGIEIAPPDMGIRLPTVPAIGGAAPALTSTDIMAALQRLRDLLGAVSPFTTCMLGGKWSFAAADLAAITGTSTLEIPYGVKVCITANCARQLRYDSAHGDLGDAATTLLAILAALNADFAAVASTLGIAKAAEALALAAVIGTTATTALTAVAALLLFLVYYAAMIAIQLQLLPESAFADGWVCIEHPTFIIAAVTVLVPIVGSLSQWTPPIVTG